MQAVVNVVMMALVALVSLAVGYWFGRDSGISEGVKRVSMIQYLVDQNAAIELLDKVHQYIMSRREEGWNDE